MPSTIIPLFSQVIRIVSLGMSKIKLISTIVFLIYFSNIVNAQNLDKEIQINPFVKTACGLQLEQKKKTKN